MAELVDAPDSKSSSSNGVWVRFPLRPPASTSNNDTGFGAVGSARALGARGQQFESANPDHVKKIRSVPP